MALSVREAVATNVGIDSYTFHRFFGEITKWEEPSQEQWTLNDFFDFADAQGVSFVSLQTVYLKKELDTFKKDIKNWLANNDRTVVFTWGHPNGFDGGRKPEMLFDALYFLQVSHELGLPQMRIVLGNHWNFDMPVQERLETLRPLVKSMLVAAEKFGIKISIENHADFLAVQVMEFIEEFNSPYLGMCLDLANVLRVGESPEQLLRDFDLDKVFMIQAKDVRKIEGHEHPTGWWPSQFFGSGDVGLSNCLKVLREKKFRSPVVAEISNLFTDLEVREVAAQAVGYLTRELNT
jgi:sugar phosphate isomerase/epimerase